MNTRKEIRTRNRVLVCSKEFEKSIKYISCIGGGIPNGSELEYMIKCYDKMRDSFLTSVSNNNHDRLITNKDRLILSMLKIKLNHICELVESEYVDITLENYNHM